MELLPRSKVSWILFFPRKFDHLIFHVETNNNRNTLRRRQKKQLTEISLLKLHLKKMMTEPLRAATVKMKMQFVARNV